MLANCNDPQIHYVHYDGTAVCTSRYILRGKYINWYISLSSPDSRPEFTQPTTTRPMLALVRATPPSPRARKLTRDADCSRARRSRAGRLGARKCVFIRGMYIGNHLTLVSYAPYSQRLPELLCAQYVCVALLVDIRATHF